MFDMKDMSGELQPLCEIEDIFGTYRIIRPQDHQVFDYRDGELIALDEKCYTMLNKVKPCKNCISARTCREAKQCMKIEFIDKQIMLVISIPVKLNGNFYSLELFKNITEGMVADNLRMDNTDITAVIKEFNNLATQDTFTGLYNKNYMLQKIEYLTSQWREDRRLFGAIMDIDRFKAVNDIYGHNIGDVVIKKIADILKAKGKKEGFLAGRFGGDEFILLSESLQESDGIRLCKELEKEIAAFSFEKDGNEFHIAVSINGGCIKEGQDFMEFIDYIDEKMYEIKNQKK